MIQKVERMKNKIEELFIILQLSTNYDIKVTSRYDLVQPLILITTDDKASLYIWFFDDEIEFTTGNLFKNLIGNNFNKLNVDDEEGVYKKVNTIIERM